MIFKHMCSFYYFCIFLAFASSIKCSEFLISLNEAVVEFLTVPACKIYKLFQSQRLKNVLSLANNDIKEAKSVRWICSMNISNLLDEKLDWFLKAFKTLE